jgi:hypothetical protein
MDSAQSVRRDYHFPKNSEVGRTSGPPTFSIAQVPTRVNSPSDVAFDTRDATGGTMSFGTTLLNATFTASNSVLPGDIHPMPNQATGGGGAVTGQEVQFNVTFTTPVRPARGSLLLRPAGPGHWRRLPVALGAKTDRGTRYTVRA